MQIRKPLTIKSVQERLGPWLDKNSVPMARQAEMAPVRRDMVTLLSFVRDNKVIGTQSTGNMPLKAIREVTAHFVNPPKLDFTMGGQTYSLRSEERLWPLHLLHILAVVGGLLKAAPARRWQLTAQGKRFLDAQPMVQAPFLLAVWWRKVNWLVAFPFEGMGEALPYFFPRVTLANLRSLPVETRVPFIRFADKLMSEGALTWTAQDSSFATELLRDSIENMVIAILDDLSALKCYYRKEPLGKGTITRLDAFKITPWGKALLNAIAALDR
jgi:hypothetical protein